MCVYINIRTDNAEVGEEGEGNGYGPGHHVETDETENCARHLPPHPPEHATA